MLHRRVPFIEPELHAYATRGDRLADGEIAATLYAPATAPKGTVLLLHGYTGDRRDLADYGHFLANHGYRAIAIDHYGHGESAGEDATVGQMAERVARVEHDLANRFPDVRERGVHVVTFSLGGNAFLHRLARVPERPVRVRSLHLLSPPLSLDDVARATRTRTAFRFLSSKHTPRWLANASGRALGLVFNFVRDGFHKKPKGPRGRLGSLKVSEWKRVAGYFVRADYRDDNLEDLEPLHGHAPNLPPHWAYVGNRDHVVARLERRRYNAVERDALGSAADDKRHRLVPQAVLDRYAKLFPGKAFKLAVGAKHDLKKPDWAGSTHWTEENVLDKINKTNA